MNCILICDSAVHSGGISAVLLAHAKGLKSLGWKVYLFAVSGPVDNELIKWLDGYQVIVDHQRPRSRLREIWSNESEKHLRDYLGKFSNTPTIAHVHNLSMALSPSISKAFKKTKVPYVITAHDAGWACPTGYLYNFQTNKRCELRPLSFKCLTSHCEKKSYFHKLFKLMKSISLDYFSDIKRNAEVIYSPSQYMTKIVASRIPKQVPVRVLMNPLIVENRGYRSPPGEHFVFVGRIWEEKGIVKLLEVIGEKFPLIVIGEGGLKDNLIKKYPKVQFIGKIHPTKICEALRDAKALILPSIYAEAFGLVVPEALSQGVPVIVSSTAGSASMIQNGANGYVVDMSYPEQLTQACELLMDNSRNEMMSKNAYEMYWQQPLSVDQYIDEIIPSYQKIIESQKRSI